MDFVVHFPKLECNEHVAAMYVDVGVMVGLGLVWAQGMPLYHEMHFTVQSSSFYF